MALHKDFPSSSHAILGPCIRFTNARRGLWGHIWTIDSAAPPSENGRLQHATVQRLKKVRFRKMAFFQQI